MKKNYKDYLITTTLILLCVWSAWNFASKGGRGGSEEVSLEVANSIHTAFPASTELSRDQVKPVVLFVTSWCGVCRSLEKKLAAQKIKFTMVDIEKDIDAARAYRTIMAERSGPVPVTLVGAQVFVGDQSTAIVSASKSI